MKNKILISMTVAGTFFIAPIIVFANSILAPTFDDISSAPISSDWMVVPFIANWSTNSQKMNGMKITATFATGGSETLIWGEDASTGGVSGNGWDLFMANPTGSTFSNGFTLDTTSREILSLLMEGASGGTLFDVDPHADPSSSSTLGSQDGVPIMESFVDLFNRQITNTDPAAPVDTMNRNTVWFEGIDIQADYYTPVSLSGATPVWDLYSNLLLTFSGNSLTTGATGFTRDNSLTFIQDTDNVGTPVPEPITVVLFGVGLISLIAGRRIRKN